MNVISESKDTSLIYLDFSPEELPGYGLSPSELSILGQINHKVAAHTSLPDIIDFVFNTMKPIRASDRLALAFLEEDGRRIWAQHVVSEYKNRKLDIGYSEDLLGSSLQKVIEKRKPRIIDDLEAYYKNHPQSRSTRLILEEGIRSSMTCPLFQDDRCVGVIFWSSRRPHAYDYNRMQRHRAIAERLSQAVENAYLIEQLKSANNSYLDMLSFVSHELKHPVSTLITNTHLLIDGYLGPLNQDQLRKLRSIRNQGDYLLGILKQYLDLARIEAGKLKLNTVAVEDVSSEILDQAIELAIPQELIENGRFERKQLHKDQPLQCDPNLIKIALVNLLTNAVKYAYGDGKITIETERSGRYYQCSVYNEGKGFSPEQQHLLFRKFSRLESGESTPLSRGTGVGLYNAWNIINLHHGKISAESEPGKWARFTLQLPLEP